MHIIINRDWVVLMMASVLKTINCVIIANSHFNKCLSVSVSLHFGGLHLKPPKFEHIFVAVITFPPSLCRYF